MTTLVIGQYRNSESHAGIGVTAVWPRHRPVMPTGRKPSNISTQRCDAAGSLAVHGEKEVTQVCQLQSHRVWDCRRAGRPEDTSWWFSTYGFTHPTNREGEDFECLRYGYQNIADYNDAKNIGLGISAGTRLGQVEAHPQASLESAGR